MPQTLANITDQGSPSHAPNSTLAIRMLCTCQHTTACANLYYRKIILVSWGVYFFFLQVFMFANTR